MLDAGMNQEQAQAQEKKANATKWVKRIAIIVVVVAVLVGIGYGLKGLLKGGEVKKQGPTKIQLKDLPPPPPPPPPKEQPKEQPKDQPKEAPKEPEPKPVDAPPPTDIIKMDGPAGDGPSQFANGPVTNENKSGNNGPVISRPSASQFYSYTSKIKSRIEDALNSDKDLYSASYRVEVYIWLTSDGRIDKLELHKPSGVVATDELIRTALATVKSIGESPPADMPQPVKLRITSKAASGQGA